MIPALIVLVLQQNGYRVPPDSIFSAAQTPWYQNVSVESVSPDGKRFLSLEKDGMVPISTLAKPFINLGGLQIDLKSGRDRGLTTQSLKNFRITDVSTGKTISLDLPAGIRVSDPKWSPDSKYIAFLAHSDKNTMLFAADAETGVCRPITARPLLPTLSSDVSWDASGKFIATVFRPRRFGNPPEMSAAGQGPWVQTSEERPRKLSTFPAVIKTNFERDLLLYYGSGQLGIVDVTTGKIKELGKPNLYESVSLSPDGKNIRTTLVDGPISFSVPVDSYATRDVLMSSDGTETLLERHPQEYSGETPKVTEESRRDLHWYQGGVIFLQTVAASSQSGKLDRVVYWPAPFLPDRRNVLYSQKAQIQNLAESPAGNSLFLTETIDGCPRMKFVNLKGGPKGATLTNLGTKGVLVTDQAGHVVLTPDGNHAFITGTTYAKDPLVETPI